LSSAIAEQRFREIVPPLLDDAYSLAKWLSQNPTDAEDIVQDAALRALQALSSVSVDRPKPWFLAIVRNSAMTFLARNRRKTVAYVGDMADLDTVDLRGDDDAAPNPEQELIALEDGERLRQAIAGLPSPFLETLVMRDINGLSYREIADATGTPVGTVMSKTLRTEA
jgi:RNA polymerase sigma factor (sigma-70 family)